MVSKNHSLNAFCLPYGTIVLHLGVFHWLQNEDQVASVLCHEVAHYLLKHSIVSQIRTVEDNKIQKQTRKVLNSGYGKTEKALTLYRSFLYENSELSRRNELQADSLGYILYKNTNYNSHDYKIAMSRMELYDTVKIDSLKISTLSQLFGIEGVEINPYLFSNVEYSKIDFYVEDKLINKDSLLSHPQVKIRINYLESLFPELKQNSSNLVSELYKEISYKAFMEQAPNLFNSKYYGDCLYLCMLHIQNEFQSEYHKVWMSKCLKEIYLARKSYTLSKYIDGLDPKVQNIAYYRFLKILWELNIDELKLLVDYYS
ncbi:MAG: M48 family metalloprotease [Saprospiraceae bacterium]|nr:M48 family metalloprotease [Candidatus Vicinibacter affinis]